MSRRAQPQRQSELAELTSTSPFFHTGIRNSQVGLALTTDAPTRHVVPDNARLSIFSTSTAASGDRSTLYSAASSDFGDRQRVMSGFSSVPSVYDVLEEEEGSERYDPAMEDGEAASMHRQASSHVSSGVKEVKPPVPPRSAAREGGHSATNSASSGRTARAGAEPGSRSRSQQQPPTITHTHGSPHRSPDPGSRLNSKLSSKSLSAPIPPSLGPSPPRASLSEPATSTDKLQQTLASAYIVAGLPKDPSTWTLADHSDPHTPSPDHSLNAVLRWRPEVLGCTTTGDGKSEGEGMRSLDGGARRTGRSSGKGEEGKAEREAFVTLTKEEVARIQGKAIKVSLKDFCGLVRRAID